jgi:hypothetical protein
MRALVLVTTNEPLGQLHPALARPGRCLAEVDFKVSRGRPFTTKATHFWVPYRVGNAMTTTSRAWRALSERLIKTLPPAARESLIGGSHVRRFEDNLLPGISIGQAAALRAQLDGGAGGELKQTRTGKRPAHAPYSSAALTINAFGPWLGQEVHLRVAGLGGFDHPLTVEHKLSIKHGGGTANLDCYLEGPAIVVGVESKLTEHLPSHKPLRWKPAYHWAEMAALSKHLRQPSSCERTASSFHRPLWVKRTVVMPSVSSKSSSISCRVLLPSQIQVNARRVGGSISV